MAQTIAYAGTTLTTVAPDSIRVVEAAYQGEAGIGEATIDDDAGTLTITGLKPWTITQSSAPLGNRRLFTGYTGDRRFRRGDKYTVGAGREIDVTLVDVNTLLGDYVISGTDGKRSAESVSARLTWLVGSAYANFTDAGLVVYPPAPVMDANDYRGQTGFDVLYDCATVTGYNFFLYYDETTDAVALFFDDSNRSSAFSSSTKISNVAADIDGTTVLAPLQEAEMVRDPAKVASSFYIPYARGATLRTKSSTATAFRTRMHVAPNANVKTLTAAQALGNRLLNDNDEEDDTITASVRVKSANVNDIRAGHRIQAKFSHFANEGYGSYTYFRVLRRTVSQPLNTDFDYQIDFELSPWVPPVVCDPATATNLALTATVSAFNDGPLADPTNLTRVQDGLDTPDSSMTSGLIDPSLKGNTYHRGWEFTWGGSQGIGFIDVRKTVSDTWPDYFAYYDGTWHVLSPTESSFNEGTTKINRETFTPVTATAIRVAFSVYAGGGLPFGYSFDSAHGVGEIRILECAA